MTVADTLNPAAALKRKAGALALAVAVAAPAEGLRQWAYRDPVGILTVCYGTTGAAVQQGKQYSLAECKALLTADMLKAVNQVERCATGLPEHQLAAWADAVYNLGPKIVCDTRPAPNGSTAARLLAAGQRDEACRQLPRWDKATLAGQTITLPGLTKRRAVEMQLCLTGRLPA